METDAFGALVRRLVAEVPTGNATRQRGSRWDGRVPVDRLEISVVEG